MQVLKTGWMLLLLALMLCLSGRLEGAEVVLKSGEIIRGELIRETSTAVILQLSSSQIEISKLNIKTIDGRPPFAPSRVPSQRESQISAEVLIPAGDFWMGDSQGKDSPLHKVYLDAYWIDTQEVTNAQYREFVEATGHAAPRYWHDPKYNGDALPVVGITYEEAQAYCAWKGKKLPTEAQWERAGRGAQSRLYPWGDRFDVTHTNTRESNNRRPVAVGSYPSGVSPDGLFDMSGNVWEWCRDWFDKDYYRASPLRNPTGPADGKKRVIRGGGWSAPQITMAQRHAEGPGKTYPSLGFRCVRSQEPEKE